MLKITFKNQVYELPLSQGEIIGSFCLDENWRSLNYKENSSLSLDVHFYYCVPTHLALALYEHNLVNLPENIDGPVINPQALPLIDLDLQINDTEYDFENEKSVLLGTLSRFPTIDELSHHTFEKNILENSTLWFPSFGQIAVLEKIAFGEKSENKLDISISGRCSDMRGELLFEIKEEKMPFSIIGKIAGYANEFVGFSKEKRFQEIKDCFSLLYNIDKYNLSERVINTEFKGVEIIFNKK